MYSFVDLFVYVCVVVFPFVYCFVVCLLVLCMCVLSCLCNCFVNTCWLFGSLLCLFALCAGVLVLLIRLVCLFIGLFIGVSFALFAY